MCLRNFELAYSSLTILTSHDFQIFMIHEQLHCKSFNQALNIYIFQVSKKIKSIFAI